MKTCSYPDCESLVEGRTDYCGTHNRIMRKQSRGITQIEVKAASKSQELSLYVVKKKVFLKGKQCELKGIHFQCKGPMDIHHRRGRLGDLLMNDKYWTPMCRKHHVYVTDHSEEAYKNGWSELRLDNEPHIL